MNPPLPQAGSKIISFSEGDAIFTIILTTNLFVKYCPRSPFKCDAT